MVLNFTSYIQPCAFIYKLTVPSFWLLVITFPFLQGYVFNPVLLSGLVLDTALLS